MSLIEEALRKQREETTQSSHESTPLKLAGVTPPPPLPEQDSPVEEPPAQRRSWVLLAAIGGIGLLLVITLIWLFFFGMKLWQSPKTRAPATVADTASRPAAAPTGTAAFAIAQNRTMSNAPAATHTATVAVSVEAPSTNPALPAAPATPSAVAVQTVAGSPFPPRDAPSVKFVATTNLTTTLTARPEAVVWPKLVISGFISTARGSHGAAIVNGQMVAPGDTIEGVRVIAVDKHGVQFRYGSETQTLAVGGTTE